MVPHGHMRIVDSLDRGFVNRYEREVALLGKDGNSCVVSRLCSAKRQQRYFRIYTQASRQGEGSQAAIDV